jgi:hypothetical protein
MNDGIIVVLNTEETHFTYLHWENEDNSRPEIHVYYNKEQDT